MKLRADRSAIASHAEIPPFPGPEEGMHGGKRSRRDCPMFPAMTAAALPAAVSLFAAMALPSGAAIAHEGTEFFGHVNPSFHDYEACPENYRVPSNTETQCANMGWTNVVGGTFHYAKNECIQYGDLVVTVDHSSFSDGHYHLDNSNKKYTTVVIANTRDMNCCANKSDLCLRQEVEADPVTRTISRWTGVGLTYATHDVSTHEKRYQHCQDYPDSIYCEVNPSGDALSAPRCTVDIDIEGIDRCEDLATVHECGQKFARSFALQTGTYIFPVGNVQCAFSTSDWDGYDVELDTNQCVITTRCPTGDKDWYGDGDVRLDTPILLYEEQTITDDLLYIGTYVNCSGTLEKLRCSQ